MDISCFYIKILFKLINKKGIINVGGKAQTVYRFVKSFDPKIKRIYANKKNYGYTKSSYKILC